MGVGRAGQIFLTLVCGLWPGALWAGAWTLPAETSQVIVTTRYSAAATEFDASGDLQARVRFDKAEITIDAEYGITDWATANVKSSVQRLGDPSAPTERYTEVLDFEVAARARLMRAGPLILSSEARIYVPGPSAEVEQSKRTDLGTRDPAYEAVALAGLGFELWGYGLFTDLQLGARSTLFGDRVDLRGDFTFGVKSGESWEAHLQSFNLAEVDVNPGVDRRRFHKVQFSVLHRLTPRFGIQTGAFQTLAGRSVVREQGALLALWVWF